MSADPVPPIEPGAPRDARPLAGVRVVELGEYVAAPLAAMMLADLGATVVKVERPPGGDPARRFGHGNGSLSPQWVNCNRNKRSVVLDLREEHARTELLRLVADAQVVVVGMRAAALERLGLGDDELHAANPALVRAYITGYGDVGPMAGAPAYDSLLQGLSGLAHVQGGGLTPTLVRSFVADKVAAMTCVQSVLAALLAGPRAPHGARLSTSMLDAMAYFDFPDVMVRRTVLADGDTPDVDDVGQAMRPIRASDGWLLVTPVTGRQIARAFEAVGRPDLQAQLRGITDRGLLARRLVEFLEEGTVSGTVQHWMTEFARLDVPCAPVHSLDGHLQDPQVLASQVYGTHVHPELGELRDVRYPTLFHGQGRFDTYAAAPSLGADPPLWDVAATGFVTKGSAP